MLPVSYLIHQIRNFVFFKFFCLGMFVVYYYFCVWTKIFLFWIMLSRQEERSSHRFISFWHFFILLWISVIIPIFCDHGLICKNSLYIDIWKTDHLSCVSYIYLLPGCTCLFVYGISYVVCFAVVFVGCLKSIFLFLQKDHVTRLWQCGPADTKWRRRIWQRRLWKGERGKLFRRRIPSPILNNFIF